MARSKTEKEPAFEPRETLKKYWSESLSAFGNTGAGVLVWGIDCPGNMPVGFSLAPNCQKWRDDLRDLVMSATDPLVSGVRIEVITSPSAPGEGVILCYLPPSDFPPHRAEWADKRYYIRDQDKSVVCPTGLLRNLFYPRKSARLSASVSATIIHDHQFGESFQIQIKIFNRGPSTADSVVVSMHLDGPARQMRCPDEGLWSGVEFPNLKRCSWPLPPQFLVPTPIKVTLAKSDPVNLQLNLYAHDNALQIARLIFTAEDVSRMKSSGAPERRSVEGVATDWQPG